MAAESSALNYAGRVYKRERGWEFPPGEAGVWLLILAPVEGGGSKDSPWSYTGHIAGFVVLSDRDQDGSYEAISRLRPSTLDAGRSVPATMAA
jgi:hypothetical protein